MSNNYFQFKQFKITQEKSAMKVSTDSVMLGSWANYRNAKTILDIGTGTGILALMAAQKCSGEITAIEMDELASKEARLNFENSPWQSRLTNKNITLQDFVKNQHTTFDIIISNPPYFQNALKARDATRSNARHTDHLPFETLIQHSSLLLNDEGYLNMILPYELEKNMILLAASHQLSISRIMRVKSKKHTSPNRVMLEFVKGKVSNPEIKEIIIHGESTNGYSNDFVSLTKDFYLKF